MTRHMIRFGLWTSRISEITGTGRVPAFRKSARIVLRKSARIVLGKSAGRLGGWRRDGGRLDLLLDRQRVDQLVHPPGGDDTMISTIGFCPCTVCPGSSDPILYKKLLNKMGHYFLDIK